MLHGHFKIEAHPSLVIGGLWLPAFSGDGEYRNRRLYMCLPNNGPIPVGTYYIVDRRSGGRLGGINDALKRDWFALYAKDKVVDDERWCAGVQRGQFRLHPKGPRGLSQGCITLERQEDFVRLRDLLRCTTRETIPGTDLTTYGMLVVS